MEMGADSFVESPRVRARVWWFDSSSTMEQLVVTKTDDYFIINYRFIGRLIWLQHSSESGKVYVGWHQYGARWRRLDATPMSPRNRIIGRTFFVGVSE